MTSERYLGDTVQVNCVVFCEDSLSNFLERILLPSRFDRLTMEKSASSSEHVETIKQLTLQNESLTKTFKVKIGYANDIICENVDTCNV